MAKNLMPKLAELLGVELNERFKICSKGCAKFGKPRFASDYFLDEKDGLMCVKEDGFCKADVSTLGKIILGDFEVMKLPWKPKHGERYYCPCVQSRSVGAFSWANYSLDYAMLALGMVYRTREEAEEHLADDYERLTGKPLSIW